MLKHADFNNENCQLIDYYDKKIFKAENNISKNSKIDLSYIIGANIICELCIQDIIEQTKEFFIYKDKEKEKEEYFLNLNLKYEHNIDFLNKQLRDLSNGEYTFPPICDELKDNNVLHNDNFILEHALYNISKLELNLNQENIYKTVKQYIRLHQYFLEDYDNQIYKMKAKGGHSYKIKF